MQSKSLTTWLSEHKNWSSLFISITAFLTYSCMYAFRKPFAVGTFEDLTFLSIDYKIWLITAQTIGYTFSKFLGIKLVSELKKNHRAIGIVILLACAQVSLILFAIIPAP
ncbi:MAG: DUF5690 family protein, partial [Cyclobacteriaceae bacterium]